MGRREDGAEKLERGEFINAVFRRHRRYDGLLTREREEEETGGEPERKARPPSILSLFHRKRQSGCFASKGKREKVTIAARSWQNPRCRAEGAKRSGPPKTDG